MAIYQPGVNMMADGGNDPVVTTPAPIASAASLGLADVQIERKLNTPAQTLTAGIDPNGNITFTAAPEVRKTYSELTPAERAAMTPDQKLAYIHEDTMARQAATTQSRVSDPMKDPFNRPAGLDVSALPDDLKGMIYYYGWVGGVSTGNWVLYRAVDNADNRAKYGAMTFGGPTQATPNSAVGANALKFQPEWNPKTGTWYAVEGSGAVAPNGGTTLAPSPTGPSTAAPSAATGPTGTAPVFATGATGAAGASLLMGTGALTNAATGATGGFAGPTDTLGLGKGLDLNTTGGVATYSQRQNAYTVLQNQFNQYGLGTLAPKILDYITQGYQSDTISLLLQDTPEYKTRFAANDARVKAGLPVLSPADYINNENAYRQYMQAAGLPKGFYDQQTDFTKFIAADVSPTELNNRIQAAASIIQNSNPAVTQALQQYYGLSQGDMIAHVLDPEVSRPLIQKQVAAAQIGAAAQAQGLGVNATTAENLYGEGVTQAQAQQGFANVALNQTPMQKLAQMWGGDAAVQGQNLVASTFGTAGSAYAEQQIKALTTRETSAFGGSAGAGKGSLGIADTSGLS